MATQSHPKVKRSAVAQTFLFRRQQPGAWKDTLNWDILINHVPKDWRKRLWPEARGRLGEGHGFHSGPQRYAAGPFPREPLVSQRRLS